MMKKTMRFLVDCKDFIIYSIKLCLKVENMKDVKKLPEKLIFNWMFMRYNK